MTGIVYTDSLQHYFKPVVGGTAFKNVSDVIAFDWSTDATMYEPEYKDTTARPSYEVARKITVEYEIDYIDGADFADFLWDNQDARNTEIELVRVATHKEIAGECEAKMATFTLMPNLPDGSAGEAIRHTGSMVMKSSGWTYGTFNEGTNTFTEATS